MVPLLRNTVLHDVECEDGAAFHRVIATRPEVGVLVLIALDTSPALPIVRLADEVRAAVVAGALRLQAHDPFTTPARPDEALTESERKRRDARWKAVGALVAPADLSDWAMFDPVTRGQRVAHAAENAKTSVARIYEWCRHYWQGGLHVGALVPSFARCGAPGQIRVPGTAKRGMPSAGGRQNSEAVGVNIDAQMARDLIKGARLYHETEGRPLSTAYLKTMGRFFNVGHTRDEDGVLVPILPPEHLRPTEHQFRYWYEKQRNLEESLKRTHGANAFELKHRQVLGSAQDLATGPGSLYQIDATLGDIYLLTRALPPSLIGRPVIYLVRDTWYGGTVVGLHIALDGPNWMGASMALQNAMMDKVEFCARFGITITDEDWPTQHKPQAVLGDRGEMLAKHADHVVKVFKTTASNAAPRRGDWKPIVERHFRTTNDELIEWLPGSVHQARNHGDPDYRLDATLTLRDFWILMIRQILFYNRYHRVRGGLPAGFSTPDGGAPTPLMLWNWGIRNRTGHLETVDPTWARVHLLPSARARVTRRGLYLHGHGLYYTCPTAAAERWFVLDPEAKGSRYVTLAYDPRDVGLVYLRDDGRGRGDLVEPCTLLREDSRFAGLTLEELHDLRARGKAQDQRNNTDDDQAWAEHTARKDAFLRDAQARRDRALADGARLRPTDITEHRAAERREVQRVEAAHPDGGAVLPGVTPSHDAPDPQGSDAPAGLLTSGETPATPDTPPAYVPAPRVTSVLERVRARRMGGGAGT